MESIPPPPTDHKVFLIVSVAFATVSFFINAIQMAALVYHDLLQNIRNVLLLNQTIAGLVTTFTVVFPIKLVTGQHPSHWQDPSEPNFFNDFSICLSLASGLFLLAIFLTITNSNLLVLEQYLNITQPRQYLKFQGDFLLVTTCITIGWIESSIFTLMPWLGWNNWQGHCLLPDVWTPTFMVIFMFALFLHMTVELVMVLKMWLVLRRKAYAINPESEEMPVTASVVNSATSSFSSNNTRGGLMHTHHNNSNYAVKLCTSTFLITFLCHLPLLIHLMAYARCEQTDSCAIEDSSRIDVFLWSSLLLLINAVANPLLYAFTDEQISKPSLDILKFCCCPFRCITRNSMST